MSLNIMCLHEGKYFAVMYFICIPSTQITSCTCLESVIPGDSAIFISYLSYSK